jgi:uncharacterized membrane protein YgcG
VVAAEVAVVVALAQAEVVVDSVQAVVSTQVVAIVAIILVEVHPRLVHFVVREIKMEMIKKIMVMPNQVLVHGEVEQKMEQPIVMIQKTLVDARHLTIQKHVAALIVGVVVDFEVKWFFYLI